MRRIRAASEGEWSPVTLVVGEEALLADRLVSKLRRASTGDGPGGFNDATFRGGTSSAGQIISAAKTLPMMAPARFVLVRGVKQMKPKDLDALSEYIADPSPSCCLVLLATKLDGRSKLVKVAKKKKVFVDAKRPKARDAQSFAVDEAKARGHRMSSRAAAALVDAVDVDLAAISDSVERLSLFVGAGTPIEPEAVAECVSQLRSDTIWALVDAVSMRDAKKALSAAGSLLANREPPLRILALVSRQLRIVAKMRRALRDGQTGQDAAKSAGAPPFKARDLTESARRFRDVDLANAFGVLARTDLALKGSKRPGEIVLQEALLRLCGGGRRLDKQRQR